MSPELQRYYEDRLGMMGTQAWGDLMEDVAKMAAATNDLTAVTDEKNLYFRQGELSIMRWLMTLKDVSEQSYLQLQEEPDAEAT